LSLRDTLRGVDASIHAIDRYLRDTQSAALGTLCELLRIPSVSTEPQHRHQVTRCADAVAKLLASVGATVETWQTDGCPAVFGRVDVDPRLPSVLIYGHYDVQPAGELARWASPPFEPRISDSGCIYARGAADNKGQFFLQVRAVEAWMRTSGRPPVNVKLLIEGEEEIGSPNLLPLLRDRRDDLACELVVISDTPLWRPGRPALSLGTRGITGLEVIVAGPDRDLHSGMYGGSFPNPIAILSQMLASLHDERGRIAVPGFYDDVKPIPPDLHDEWERLALEIDSEQARFGCRFSGESGFNPLERRWLRPTLEFNGITGGYQGPGSNTIIPSRASAKITCRLVPDQDPDGIQSTLKQRLESLAPPGTKLEFILRRNGARPYSIRADHPALAAAGRVMAEVYGTPPVRVREGLSLPILPMFRNLLGADTVLLGFCDPACNAHSFDEFIDSTDVLRGAQAAARFLGELPGVLEVRR
jgi:acetylornithine deacetylase/succinyl-diaminopimelate desuccinylase-like protein